MATDTKKKILIIDDDEVQLITMDAMLSDEFEITALKSGKEALEYLSNQYIPSLILLDIVMPKMDGWETYSKIRGIGIVRNVPIAFITSSGTAEENRALAMGAADYILKPFNKSDLISRIKNAIQKFETKNNGSFR